jgi:hypothetical protein
MIKYQIKEGQTELLFHIDKEGSLIIEANGQEVKISHLVAIELIEILQHKLYEHQSNSQSFLKRIFR